MSVMSLALGVSIVLLSAALVLSICRLVIGPTTADSVAALDLTVTSSIGIITIAALAYDERVLLDIAIVVALIAFLSTVAFAHYLEERSKL